ncbi:tyrosine-type recombinase/integrase [Ligilactobacillus murinus]|nr:tyrosine-type recombinase/integrase [Ligilactobacillus murinus]
MVFENARGQIPTSAAANNTLRTLLKQAEIKKPSFHFHSLRHTHVAYLLSKGIDIFVISKRLGHSDLSTTTDTYAYLIHEYQQTQISEIKKNLALLAE